MRIQLTLNSKYTQLLMAAVDESGDSMAAYCRRVIVDSLTRHDKRIVRDITENRWRQWAEMTVDELLSDPIFIIQPRSKRNALLTYIRNEEAKIYSPPPKVPYYEGEAVLASAKPEALASINPPVPYYKGGKE